MQDFGASVDDRLASLLRKDYESSEGGTWVQIGDQRIAVHPSFQLFILANSGDQPAHSQSYFDLHGLNAAVCLKNAQPDSNAQHQQACLAGRH